MKVLIKKGRLQGSIIAPPSKSYSHRYLIASMLANSKNTSSNVFYSDDVKATLSCLSSFGSKYEINGDSVIVYPCNTNTTTPIFDCNESGSTLRFLIPIALSKYDHVIFKGSKRLLQRGISEYERIFTPFSIEFIKKEEEIEIKGKLKPGKYIIKGDISSQYISGLLFALPLLNNDSVIELIPPIYSKNYIDMTLEVLKAFSIKFEISNNQILIKGNQIYKSIDAVIEGDHSNAAFLDAFNYFNGNINVLNLNSNSLQGDKVYKEYFELLSKDYQTLDISNCIDLGPILFVFASLNHGGKFIGTKRLKIKESDRALAIKEELSKIGINIIINEDDVIVEKNDIKYTSMSFNSHNDHRIAMALSLLSCKMDVTINDASCINKSYPNYFKDLISLGADVYEIE